MVDHVRVAIVGAGFGGIGMAIRLRFEGERDFLVFERADEVGGTWRDNRYPGCACDVPSDLYSFSFAPNPDWSSTYSGQPEILAYLRDCVDRFGLTPYLRLGHGVRDLAWDPATRRWSLDTSGGAFTADVVVLATGPLSEPAVPDLPGLDSFAGTSFHSAGWRDDHDLTGRRVAVVGTGASAVQFVPQVHARAASLIIFQRTPPWIVPRLVRPTTDRERARFRDSPAAQRRRRARIYWVRELLSVAFRHPWVMRGLRRVAARHLRRQVGDPLLRERLTPSYLIGCKRILASSDYLPTLTEPGVTLVTEPIREVLPHAVVTGDGAVHEVDTIIFGTGFRVTDVPMAHHVRGCGGRTLADAWQPSMRAYLGLSVNGFPNLFLLLGPNTGLGHTSVVLMIESQITHVLGALSYLRRAGVVAIEPKPEAVAGFSAEVDRGMRGTVWMRGGCRSWYLDATGRNSTLWPGFTFTYRRRARFRADAYQAV